MGGLTSHIFFGITMNKKNVTPALILDMYAHLVTNGKQVKTYLKLQLPIFKDDKGKERYEVIEVDVSIPQEDIQSRKVMVGKKVLIERVNKDNIIYLGPEGDWETMMQYGIAPNDYAKFDAKFHGFSEDTSPAGIEYIEDEYHITIRAGEHVLAEADVASDGLHNCRYKGEIGKKLLIDWGRPRGLNFPLEQMFSD